MRNEVIFDDRGRPDILVVFTPDELKLPDTLKGRKVKEYAISKYPNTMIDGRPYGRAGRHSQPGADNHNRISPAYHQKPEGGLRPSQYKYKEDNTVQYRPKIIKGTVKGTGWPIDGHTLYFSQWDYDNRESWHLYGWDEPDDEAVMQTTYQTETAAGLCLYDTLEGFTEAWKAKKWEPQGAFCLTLEQVDVVEVLQEEVRNETREELRDRGFDLTPRKYSDKGGILCLPLDKNLNGDTKKKHPDWELIDCPLCGQKCWKMPAADKLKEAQDVTYLCTECAIKAGFLSDYPRNRRKPGGNREQRRRAKRNARK